MQFTTIRQFGLGVFLVSLGLVLATTPWGGSFAGESRKPRSVCDVAECNQSTYRTTALPASWALVIEGGRLVWSLLHREAIAEIAADAEAPETLEALLLASARIAVPTEDPPGVILFERRGGQMFSATFIPDPGPPDGAPSGVRPIVVFVPERIELNEPKRLDLGTVVPKPAANETPAKLRFDKPIRDLSNGPAEIREIIAPSADPPNRAIHRVGYNSRPVDEAPYVFRAAHPVGDWSSIASNKVSCHFQGSSLTEIAGFLHYATGLTVHVDPDADRKLARGAGVHVLCRDKSIRQSLRVVLGSCGMSYLVKNGELFIGEPEGIRQLHEEPTGNVEEFWQP